jgi:ribonuclease P protein component
MLPRNGRPGTDYVLIARATTVDRPYKALIDDLEAALRRVDHGRGTVRLSAAEEE